QGQPNGVPDWHIQLQGLRGSPVRVQIISTAGGGWDAPSDGHHWVIFAQYGASGAGDPWFQSLAAAGFRVIVWYTASLTDEADATTSLITSRLPATSPLSPDTALFRSQGQPNGVPDWHIQLQGLRGSPVRVQITSTAGAEWDAPSDGYHWVIFAQYG